MSSAGQSVFISYTREDLAATRRIADALSAFEVEVWFDQDGLEGGDLWDQKIRKQIKACSLFIPVISARTEARREAYFRLEWKLAEERTHLMAQDHAFLLPVCIDDTVEDGAVVPESFRRAQWMRLPRGVPNTLFVDRVRTLLARQRAQPASPAAVVPPATPPVRVRRKWLLPVAVGLAVSAGASLLFWAQRKPAPPGLVATASPVAAVDKSIAVLPFTNMSDDKENAYFADGVHEDILTNLANIAALKVISRTSMLQYRGTTKTVRQIGQELGVAYVLEGSVRRAGSKVRVTGQLISTTTDEHLWAKNYDRDLTDIFAIQSEVAHTIVASLKAVLTPRESASLETTPTTNAAAYDAYLRSRREVQLSVDARTVLDTALPWLEQAVQLDPQFGRAWAMISMLQINLSLNGIDREARRQLGREALIKAEALAPDDYLVLQVGAHYYSATRNRPLANERRRRIIELFPGQAPAQSAIGLMAQFDGDWSGALAAFRMAYDLDPRNPDMAFQYYAILRTLRRYPEAESVLRTMVTQDPENLEYQLWLAELPYLSRGAKSGLEEFLARLPARPGPDEVHYHTLRSQTLERLGDPDRLITFWENAGTRWKSAEDAIAWGNAAVAAAYETRGNATAARVLRQAYRVVLEKALVDDDGRQRPYLLNRYGATLALLGEIEPARQALAEVRQIVTTQTDRSASLRTGVAWHNALWRVVVGEKAEALAELKRTFREPFGPNVYELRNEWEGQPLRGDSKFEALFTDPANNAPLL